MISIVVIGKNEGWKLTQCLESIFILIKNYPKLDFEVIYVDSKSEDNSIARAQSFPSVQIFKITGKANAAFARNIGAKEAKGEILFFVDGDMELASGFLGAALNRDYQLKHDCLTGHLDDYFYDFSGNYLGKKPRTYKNEIPSKEIVLKTNGGIFLIKKDNWNLVGGMRTKYKVNEDIDLSLRLSEKGIQTIRIPSFIAKHHTVSYNNEIRMWDILRQGNLLYPGMNFRDHIKKTFFWIKTIRAQYSSFLLLLTIVSMFFLKNSFVFLLFIYFAIITLRKWKNIMDIGVSKRSFFNFIAKILYQILSDFFFWGGFLFFHPRDEKTEYIKI